MKSDITTREDIVILIESFYQKLLDDEHMSPFFKDIVAKGKLKHHLEVITDFWEDILLHSTKYKNNTMQKHVDFASKIPFKKEHFKIWVSYFFKTLDEHFLGENVEVLKNRVRSIATVMQLKLNVYEK
ncbi:hemoglobin [Lutibacter sp. Hel_I_33_5]|uniref:group III truncated hemoglobin n=1 Tax=Lutibacter sp. Hel_I_33_5 TaxID=1566289 RepID=UPI0011A3B6B7|nr:group III truncated hemoglobin [Lutibacter sp. Hel_I_33_5]TVZ55477.1 hemoglobin [Lutibacter sp. Hel_I_33_5]